MVLGIAGEDEFACFHSRYCLVKDRDPLDVALACPLDTSPGGTIVKLSLYVYEGALKMPETLCRNKHACLCFRDATAFPFKDPVEVPVCAVCCVRVLPQPIGLLAPPTSGKGWPARPMSEVMQRVSKD
jgi:hypothetical protein